MLATAAYPAKALVFFEIVSMSKFLVTADPELKSSSILRRYMDLAKLLDLLHSKSLYLRRADGFTDRLEGALFRNLRESFDDEFKKGNIKTNADGFYRNAREGNYVSCWTIGARDNMALWQLYGGVKTSVVVTTTVEKLATSAIAWNRKVHLYKVAYVDHARPPNYVIGPPRDILKFKSDAYKFENEMRIVVPQLDRTELNPSGIKLQINDLNSLVRSVVVAPEADQSFVEAVADLCKKYGLNAPVRRSALAFVPT
jgi:hypothetical protein